MRTLVRPYFFENNDPEGKPLPAKKLYDFLGWLLLWVGMGYAQTSFTVIIRLFRLIQSVAFVAWLVQVHESVLFLASCCSVCKFSCISSCWRIHSTQEESSACTIISKQILSTLVLLVLSYSALNQWRYSAKEGTSFSEMRFCCITWRRQALAFGFSRKVCIFFGYSQPVK